MSWNTETKKLMERIAKITGLEIDTKNSKIPADASDTAHVDGVWYTVLPTCHTKFMRVMAECPKCGKQISASRLAQHNSRRDHGGSGRKQRHQWNNL